MKGESEFTMTQIKPQRGLDTIRLYVPGKPIEEVQREYGLEDVIKMASNENPLGSSPKALAAIEKALGGLSFYPDGQSYYLCHALAQHLGVEPQQVKTGNGIDGLIVEVCHSYLEESSEVIFSRSSFPAYKMYTLVMRATPVETPKKNYGLDLEAMARAITSRTRLIFVCNPNNPTGTMVTAAEVESFMTRVPDHVLVVFDEAYYEFAESDEFPDTLRYVREGRKNVITTRTFSKVYGLAGVRLGYAIAAPEVLAPLNKIKEPFAVNSLAQVAGLAALEDGEFLKKTVETNHAERLFLYGEFERLGLNYIRSHTNFILLEVGPQAVTVFRELLKRGVIVRSCTGYDLPDFLRITVGTRQQNTRLVREIESVLSR
jgi:histidinol-phosphate aminotransferase